MFVCLNNNINVIIRSEFTFGLAGTDRSRCGETGWMQITGKNQSQAVVSMVFAQLFKKNYLKRALTVLTVRVGQAGARDCIRVAFPHLHPCQSVIALLYSHNNMIMMHHS